MKKVIIFAISFLFAFQNDINAQGDSCAADAILKRVKFRLAADTPNSINNVAKQPVLKKEELQLLLSDRQFKAYNHARRCYHASIPLLSIGAVFYTLGLGMAIPAVISDNLGTALECVFFCSIAYPFLIPGVILISHSAKKLNKIANDYNSRHYQSNLQIQFGFSGNGIGVKLNF